MRFNIFYSFPALVCFHFRKEKNYNFQEEELRADLDNNGKILQYHLKLDGGLTGKFLKR